MFLFILFK